MARVFIGIGSNLGDRAANIAGALALVAELPQTRLVQVSSIIETEPVGDAEQGKFLNAAAELETTLEPLRLLDALQEIERSLGRVRHSTSSCRPVFDTKAQTRREPAEGRTRRWGPRTIDLDILLYDNRRMQTPRLAVPHPLMAEREFVLRPLAEIAPDVLHPETGRTVAELLAALQRR